MSRGVVASILASVLFGALYYLTSRLTPLSGEAIFGWRVVLTLPIATAFAAGFGGDESIRRVVRLVRERPLVLFGLALSSALLGIQFWLFTWAPVHGRALEVSLGYFLLPLAMVLVGRVVYGERLSRFQQLATFAAVLGVGNELFVLGNFAWPTMVVALGYPVYFVLRRTLGTDHFGGLWCDMLLMVPVAVWFLVASDRPLAVLSDHPKLFVLLPLMGLMSAGAVSIYMLASRLLPFGLFGLLSYVEPVLLVLVALLLGEGLASGQLLTYVPIWIAVALLAVEGAVRLRRSRAGGGRGPGAPGGPDGEPGGSAAETETRGASLVG